MNATASKSASLRELRRILRGGHFTAGLAMASACAEPAKRAVWLREVLKAAVAESAQHIGLDALERGAAPNGVIGTVSILTLAVRHGLDTLAERLIEARADVNAQLSEDQVMIGRNQSALMCAAERPSLPLMRRLLEHGADLRARTSAQRTVTQCALRSDDPIGALHVLLAHGLRPAEVIGDEAPLSLHMILQDRPEIVEAVRAWHHRQRLAPPPAPGPGAEPAGPQI